MRHHARPAETLFSSGDVVLGDERIRGVKHHARTAETLFGSEDVVPGDEEIRASGERSTTPSPLKPCLARRTWCPATKE